MGPCGSSEASQARTWRFGILEASGASQASTWYFCAWEAPQARTSHSGILGPRRASSLGHGILGFGRASVAFHSTPWQFGIKGASLAS